MFFLLQKVKGHFLNLNQFYLNQDYLLSNQSFESK